MKKIYSVIVLLCGICIAGFACDNVQVNVSGLREMPVVSPDCSIANNEVPTQTFDRNFVFSVGSNTQRTTNKSADVHCVTLSSISVNNLRSRVGNNSASSLRTGFLIHTLFDEHSPTMFSGSSSTGSNHCRFFLFIASGNSDPPPPNATQLYSRISSRIKTWNYG